MNIKHSLLAGAALLALASCNDTHNTGGDSKAVRKLLDPANMDTSVRPNDNFYLYANGAWLKNNPIPADQTRWGSFSELVENNNNALRSLLDDAGKSKATAGSKEQMAGDFYKSGMDSAAIDKAGIAPLKPYLDRINGITDAAGLLHEIANEHTMGVGSVFGFYVAPDDKNVSKEISQFFQGGLGMPDRDYYFKADKRSADIREAYKAYLVQLMTMMGSDSATAKQDAADEYGLEEKAGCSIHDACRNARPIQRLSQIRARRPEQANAGRGLDGCIYRPEDSGPGQLHRRTAQVLCYSCKRIEGYTATGLEEVPANTVGNGHEPLPQFRF